ncbi:MAG: DUF6335 family protein [Chloroflexota bacterium]|nr:DUF6335 family protein [Anaerolineales bacterium]
MAKEKKNTKKNKAEGERIEKTIDPYTGELKPVPEDADQFIEVVPEETDDRRGSNYLLNEESSMDSYAADADADAVAEEAAHYTDDEDVKADFAERQNLAASGRNELEEELDEHHSLSPAITAGDVDASWQTANVAGEETLGGSSPTPDQDIVDNLGAAAGLLYKDDEPLDYDQKVLARDRDRWELNPASADDEEDEELDDEDLDEDDLDDELDGLEDLDDSSDEEEENDDEDLDDEDTLTDEDLDDEDDEDV